MEAMAQRRTAHSVRVTTAPRSRADEQAGRQRRYLISMGIRTLCFVGAVIADGWLRWVLVAARRPPALRRGRVREHRGASRRRLPARRPGRRGPARASSPDPAAGSRHALTGDWPYDFSRAMIFGATSSLSPVGARRRCRTATPRGRPAPPSCPGPVADRARQPPMADIGRSGWRNDGSSIPWPGSLPAIATTQRSAISSSVAPARSAARRSDSWRAKRQLRT